MEKEKRIKTICVLGAESTGTTTLAKSLAKHYKTAWVAEYGREYCEKNNKLENDTWTSEEFEHIALEQNKLEDSLKEKANNILICDTNAFATNLWHERYMGFMSPTVKKLADTRAYNLYILTDVDIPFVQDGTRDGEFIRHDMHKRFLEELQKQETPFIIVSGSRNKRISDSVRVIDTI